MRNHLFGDHSRHILRQHSQYYVYFFRTTRPCQLYIEDVSVYVVLVGGAWALLVGRNSCLESGRQRSALTQSFEWMLTRKAPDHMGVGENQCLPHFTLRSLLSCIMNDTHVVRLPLLMIVTIHGVSLKKPSGVRYLEHSRFVYQKCVLWVQRSLPRSTQRARRLTVLTLAFTANPMMGCFYVTRQHCD